MAEEGLSIMFVGEGDWPDPIKTRMFEPELLEAHMRELAPGRPLVIQHAAGTSVDLIQYTEALGVAARAGRRVVIQIVP